MRLPAIVVICVSLSTLAACSPKPDEASASRSASAVAPPEIKLGGLVLRNYAMRAPLGTLDNTAAYLAITNTSSSGDRLLSVECSCAEVAQTHTMSNDNGMMTMAESKEGFEIPAGSTLTLAPGGNHIMLVGLKTRPAAGSTQGVIFNFEKAGKLTVAVPVVSQIAAAAPESEAHAHH